MNNDNNFDKIKNQQNNVKVGGTIEYFGLHDWWINNCPAEECDTIFFYLLTILFQ